MSLPWKSLFKKRSDNREERFKAELEERQTMIEGIQELRDKTVKEIMIPRVDVQFISSDITIDELYGIIQEQGYSRYPVYEQTIDNIVGVLYAKDIIRNGIDNVFDAKTLMRQPYFIPESKHLDDLLREFKLRKVHIAIAIDEYGGVSGIVCMEDILEVIVGDIQDEFDDDEDDGMRKLDDNTFVVDARTSIEDLNESVGLHLSEEEYETVGGYVFELFGRIPLKDESVEDDEAIFTVEDIDGHKINQLKLVVKT
ncbi:MAG: hemolysin family protein [Sphaerochaeta sp.]|nr:hemolysin family protein [uncultured Sphaerochaeta sp.]MDC7230917.1 hemolysin family protein [Sphaerochaetaceae bacterium]MDD4301123.1 hemolysin family protein [Sphaerochaeta sp.]MDD4648257.1 hemolysin family protein [Sphaerochaeta sp.]